MKIQKQIIQELTDLIYTKAQKLDEEMIAISQNCYNNHFIDDEDKKVFMDALLEIRDKFYSIAETLGSYIDKYNTKFEQYENLQKISK